MDRTPSSKTGRRTLGGLSTPGLTVALLLLALVASACGGTDDSSCPPEAACTTLVMEGGATQATVFFDQSESDSPSSYEVTVEPEILVGTPESDSLDLSVAKRPDGFTVTARGAPGRATPSAGT
jgi:hypothetical protein